MSVNWNNIQRDHWQKYAYFSRAFQISSQSNSSIQYQPSNEGWSNKTTPVCL